jgi:dipeptidyl aminopeptidase/acylaminoacyl peptidase
VSVIRDASGTKIATLEQADISRLVAMGWKPPTPFTVRARDGVTVLYGLMYTPTNLDESGSYPVLNYLYPGPQSGSVGSRAFRPSRDDKQSLAELGFVVVELDAMGTPGRSKSFHEAYYGDMGDNGLPDQIAGIKELASRHPWMDLDRVGIWGHSGGGFASTAGILRYPEFYKVAVSGAGNHDNRNYEDDWGEKWQGLLMESDDTTNYDSQANQLIADRLQGKLLLGHGTMDTNVPFYNTLLVVNALIAANKDFDLVLLPNRSHGFGREAYWMRRRWDYFVRYLLGTEPPAGYEITTSASR